MSPSHPVVMILLAQTSRRQVELEMRADRLREGPDAALRETRLRIALLDDMAAVTAAEVEALEALMAPKENDRG